MPPILRVYICNPHSLRGGVQTNYATSFASLSPTSLLPKSLACLKGENVLVSKNTMTPTCIAIDIMLDPKANELK